jgi:hypothetical protein
VPDFLRDTSLLRNLIFTIQQATIIQITETRRVGEKRKITWGSLTACVSMDHDALGRNT